LTIEELLGQTYDGFLTNGKGDFWHSVEEAREAIFDKLEYSEDATVYGVERVNFEIDYLKIVRFVADNEFADADFDGKLDNLLYFELYEFLELSYDYVDFSLNGVDEFIKEIKEFKKRIVWLFNGDAVKKIVDRFNAQNQHIWLMDVDRKLQATITNDF
jgi:hypothetical protein